jgi:hypothetical protein
MGRDWKRIKRQREDTAPVLYPTEALGARRRNLAGETFAITESGKCERRRQGDGSGRSTDDGRAAKRARREGPGPISDSFVEVRHG